MHAWAVAWNDRHFTYAPFLHATRAALRLTSAYKLRIGKQAPSTIRSIVYTFARHGRKAQLIDGAGLALCTLTIFVQSRVNNGTPPDNVFRRRS